MAYAATACVFLADLDKLTKVVICLVGQLGGIYH